MAKIILAMFATLDGFVEDMEGAMVRPAWSDDLERFWSAPNIDAECTLLYGARAFEQNAAIWPGRPPIWETRRASASWRRE